MLKYQHNPVEDKRMLACLVDVNGGFILLIQRGCGSRGLLLLCCLLRTQHNDSETLQSMAGHWLSDCTILAGTAAGSSHVLARACSMLSISTAGQCADADQAPPWTSADKSCIMLASTRFACLLSGPNGSPCNAGGDTPESSLSWPFYLSP